MTNPQPLLRLVRKLQVSSALSEREVQVLCTLPINVRSYPANADLLRQGDRPTQCCLLVEGYLCQFKIIGSGRRQITALHLPGDVPDLQSLHLPGLDQYMAAIGPVVVGFISHGALRTLTLEHPGLAGCLWRETLLDAAISREWIVRLGARHAQGRIAHLLCEQALRFERIGAGGREGFPLYFNQSMLADIVGTSIVHVNRMLQGLRAEKLIAYGDGDWSARQLEILDWEGLAEAADFNPDYLH
jgi:CRP-like cAMP-binding protein